MDTPNSIGSQALWASDLTVQSKVLRIKKQLLEAAVTKGRTDKLYERLAEIREITNEFALQDYMILPNSEEISKLLNDASKSCNIIEAAIKINKRDSSKKNREMEDEDDEGNYEDSGIKLKALNPPKYHGDEESWLSFWEQFEAMVDKKKMPDSSKHRILINECLKGEALKAVKGINPNSRNYKTSIATLKLRFGNHDKLATFYYNKLETLPRSKDAVNQLSTYEEISKILANLASLDVETNEKLLCEKILQKFNSSTLMWVWAILEGNNLGEEPGSSVILGTSVETLMKAIGKVVHRRRDINHYLGEETQEQKVKKSSTKEGRAAPPVLTGVNAAADPCASGGPKCVFCSRKHLGQDCHKYGTLKKRRERLTDQRKCLVCGSKLHKAKDCSAPKNCQHCGKPNHSVVTCVEYIIANKKKAKEQGKSSNVDTKPPLTNLEGTFMESFICKIKDSEDNYIDVKGLLDGGSNASYITNSMVDRLKLKQGKRSLSRVCNFGSKKVICQASNEVVVTLKNHLQQVKSFIIKTTNTISGVVISSPTPACVRSILPNNLAYADPNIFLTNQRTFDLLIGIDLYNKLVNLTSVKRLPCGIDLKDTFFGWVPSGSLENNEVETELITDDTTLTTLELASNNVSQKTYITSPKNLNDDELDKFCSLFWSLEVLGIRNSQLEETNETVLNNHRETVRRDDNGRFIVRWPYKKENPSLPSNYRVSFARLRKTLEKTEFSVLEQCDKNFKEQLSLGIIEPAPQDSPFMKHYIPWKPVFQKGKIRVVYKASAKTKSGTSLNDIMHTGPKLLTDLVTLLLDFRLHEVGLTADIEKAFLMVGLNEVDRDATRFIWVRDISKPLTPDNIIIFRFARTPFGVIASPFLLNIVLQDLLTSPNVWLKMC